MNALLISVSPKNRTHVFFQAHGMCTKTDYIFCHRRNHNNLPKVSIIQKPFTAHNTRKLTVK